MRGFSPGFGQLQGGRVSDDLGAGKKRQDALHGAIDLQPVARVRHIAGGYFQISVDNRLFESLPAHAALLSYFSGKLHHWRAWHKRVRQKTYFDDTQEERERHKVMHKTRACGVFSSPIG
jgi:hypothetical protein